MVTQRAPGLGVLDRDVEHGDLPWLRGDDPEPYWDWRTARVLHPEQLRPSPCTPDVPYEAASDRFPVFAWHDPEALEQTDPRLDLPLDLAQVIPSFELDDVARRSPPTVDTTREPEDVRHAHLVRRALRALDVDSARARLFATHVIEGSRNPKASIDNLAALTTAGRTLDELELAWELKHAWKDELECGERMHIWAGYLRTAGYQLCWTEALRIIDAFDALPQLEELVALIGAVHVEWIDDWADHEELGIQARSGVAPPESYFASYLRMRLYESRAPIPMTRWGLH